MGEDLTPARALIIYLNLAGMARQPIIQEDIRPLALRAIEHINELESTNARLVEDNRRLREALKGILSITDRDHVAWDRARAALQPHTGETHG